MFSGITTEQEQRGITVQQGGVKVKCACHVVNPCGIHEDFQPESSPHGIASLGIEHASQMWSPTLNRHLISLSRLTAIRDVSNFHQ